MIRSASARVVTRTSISADACAGTTLVVVPPWITPTFSVVPAAGSCRSWTRRTWWASSTIALRPSSGATPAWAALPWISRRNRPTPFRAVLRLAVGQRRLEHQDIGTLSGHVLDQSA